MDWFSWKDWINCPKILQNASGVHDCVLYEVPLFPQFFVPIYHSLHTLNTITHSAPIALEITETLFKIYIYIDKHQCQSISFIFFQEMQLKRAKNALPQCPEPLTRSRSRELLTRDMKLTPKCTCVRALKHLHSHLHMHPCFAWLCPPGVWPKGL